MIVALQCAFCKHFFGKPKDNEDYKCTAFPTGIPAAIEAGYENHYEPLPGDHGIQFQPKTERIARMLKVTMDGKPLKESAE